MKLFISYARVDRRFCTQLVELLDEAHDVWYDQRLYVGERWWEVICREIDNCEGFIYLVSPDSLASEYCQKEYRIAVAKHKIIFPVIIQTCEKIPPDISRYQHVDISKGLTVLAVKELLNAITVAERSFFSVGPRIPAFEPPIFDEDTVPFFNEATFIDEAAQAIEDREYDRAIFLLRRAEERGVQNDFVSVEKMLRFAEKALEKEEYNRDAARSYSSIVSLMNRLRTRELGCMAFQQFRQRYPDYDPENIAGMCARLLIPMLDWCTIPAGEVTLEYEDRKVTYHVATFQMSKHPITNAQFKMFVDAPDGYCEARWWDFSGDACEWRTYHATPLKERVPFGDHPRVNISWYEAMAFCNWLSDRTGMKITLPDEQQWQRAAQGDDGRQYPWGNRFDKMLCNCAESKIGRTTAVTRFLKGVSPFGVMDMAGNVWEWCATARPADKKLPEGEQAERVIRGGSYSSPFRRIRNTQRLYLKPNARYSSIGFRVMAEMK